MGRKPETFYIVLEGDLRRAKKSSYMKMAACQAKEGRFDLGTSSKARTTSKFRRCTFKSQLFEALNCKA